MTEQIVCVRCGQDGHRSGECPWPAETAAAPACMGGWCAKRNGCSLYLAKDRREPAERLCIKGFDGVGADLPVRFHKPVGSWERGAGGLLAPATAVPS